MVDFLRILGQDGNNLFRLQLAVTGAKSASLLLTAASSPVAPIDFLRISPAEVVIKQANLSATDQHLRVRFPNASNHNDPANRSALGVRFLV